MSLKRRNGEGGDEMTGREKKKLKVSTARTIAVQPSPVTSNAVAGPSSSKPKDSTLSDSFTDDNQLSAFIGLLGLPAALDVENFIEVGLLYIFPS